jgi:hypothetical protein
MIVIRDYDLMDSLIIKDIQMKQIEKCMLTLKPFSRQEITGRR